MVRKVLVCVFVLVAASARAQTPYVAGTIGADVSRSSHTESNFNRSTSTDSEVLSGSLRVGTSVGENWGVDVEFLRSGESHDRIPIGISPLAAGGVNLSQLSTLIPGTSLAAIALPIAAFDSDVRRTRMDFDTAAWVRQHVSGSVDLVYLGGLAFSRQRIEISQTLPTIAGLFAPVPGGAFRTTTIDYGTHPLVGAEARIGLTSHMRLIPGIRLQGIANGWLLRPYAGLGWFF